MLEKDKQLKLQRDRQSEEEELIRSQLESLMELSQRQFALYEISKDPKKNKIPEESKEEIIDKSIACGKKEGQKLIERYKDHSASEIASKLGIQVKYKDQEDSPLDALYFGLYDSPNTITLYKKNISIAESLLEKLEYKLINVSLVDMVLSHELFHFIEFHNKTLYTNTKGIKLWSLGKFYTRTSKLNCTSEIAAMSFSKALLGLNFDPNILDYIFLTSFNFEKGKELFHRIMALE